MIIDLSSKISLGCMRSKHGINIATCPKDTNHWKLGVGIVVRCMVYQWIITLDFNQTVDVWACGFKVFNHNSMVHSSIFFWCSTTTQPLWILKFGGRACSTRALKHNLCCSEGDIVHYSDVWFESLAYYIKIDSPYLIWLRVELGLNDSKFASIKLVGKEGVACWFGCLWWKCVVQA